MTARKSRSTQIDTGYLMQQCALDPAAPRPNDKRRAPVSEDRPEDDNP
jgi:hypothetical protein